LRVVSKDRGRAAGYISAMDLDRLRTIPLLAELDEPTLRGLAAVVSETSVPAGRHVIREGDYAYAVLLIQEGGADVIRGGRRIATLGPGDFFGEIGVLDKSLRTASVVATTPMRLVSLSRWHLKRIGPAIDELRATVEERKRSFAA
jgi:CRP-like cAMP-binding protein